MKIDVKNKLLKLLKRNEKLVIKDNEDMSYTISESKTTKISSLKPERYMYFRLENVKINDDFKYYHYDLTGNTKIDFDNLFGIHDAHGSLKVLEHSFRDNYLKIKRSYDINLEYDNGVYNIYNGRHRLIYLKAFYEKYHCMGNNGYYEVPALVSYYVENEVVNNIVTTLSKEYGASIHKGNYFDDEMAFFIVISNKLYIVNNEGELEDFYNHLKDSICENKYFVSDVTNEKNFVMEDIFQSIFDKIGRKLFEMSFTDLLTYIEKNGIFLGNKKITLRDLNIGAIYAYHLHICESFQACKVYGYDIPNGLEIIKVRSEPINVYGAIIMDFLYDNPIYQDLKWEELLEIISKFTRFKDCDSELLRESAMRFGYIEGSGQVQKKKKNYFLK